MKWLWDRFLSQYFGFSRVFITGVFHNLVTLTVFAKRYKPWSYSCVSAPVTTPCCVEQPLLTSYFCVDQFSVTFSYVDWPPVTSYPLCRPALWYFLSVMSTRYSVMLLPVSCRPSSCYFLSLVSTSLLLLPTFVSIGLLLLSLMSTILLLLPVSCIDQPPVTSSLLCRKVSCYFSTYMLNEYCLR
jgi:hypothetical protein